MINYQGAIQPTGFSPLPENWTSEWETFPASDGKIQLFGIDHHVKDWRADRENAHRSLFVVHGQGEHGGRYLHFPHEMQSLVDSMYCADLRGHGRSEGLRGHVERFDLYAEDSILALKRWHDALRKRFGKAEIHLFGHSMGGLIALRMLLMDSKLPIASVTVSSPLLQIAAPVPWAKKMFGRGISKIWGDLQLSNELDAGMVSRDPAVVEAYKKDRLVHNKVTPRFFTELEAAMKDTLKRGGELNYPIQFAIPLADRIVNSDVSIEFFRKIADKDKAIRTYPDFFHESFNEIGKERPFEDFKSWISSHRKS